MQSHHPNRRQLRAPPATAPAGQTSSLPSLSSSTQPTPSTQSHRIQRPTDTSETRRRRKEEYYGFSQEKSRPRFENEHKSTPHLNQLGAEFESIRLATRTQEWYHDRVPDGEPTELPAQKGILRISDTEQAVQPRRIYMTPIKMTEIFTPNTWYTTHHNAAANEHRGHTPWQRSYTNMRPRTRDNVDTNAIHRITIMRLHRTRSTNTICTWTTEAGEDTCTPIPGMSNFTHNGNPDSNSSRTATGQRITTIFDQAKHRSETKPTVNGTRRLTLDHTPWMGP